MLRPEAFSQPHIAFRNTLYLRETPRPFPSATSVNTSPPLEPVFLTRGEIIWTRSRFALGDMPARTVAFVEGIGLISLDPRWLVPAELYDTGTPAPPPRPAHSPVSPRNALRSVS